MFGKSLPRPPTGTPIGRRQRELLDTVTKLTQAQGGRGTMWTPAGPLQAPIPAALMIGYAQPAGVIPAATGTWPDLTAGEGSADVYLSVARNLAPIAVGRGATIFNWLPKDTTAGARLILKSNGDGSWDVIGQACP